MAYCIPVSLSGMDIGYAPYKMIIKTEVKKGRTFLDLVKKKQLLQNDENKVPQIPLTPRNERGIII